MTLPPIIEDRWLEMTAERMAQVCAERETRERIYFRDSGGRIQAHKGVPRKPAFIVDYPFVPSFESCCDMVLERQRTGRVVTYDQARWEMDPRITEQAGLCVICPTEVEELMASLQVAA